MTSSNANVSAKNRTSISGLVRTSWSRLWRSREQILLTYYQNFAQSSGIALPEHANVSDARSIVYEQLTKTAALPSDSAITATEASVVKSERLTSLWMVFWVNVFPMAVCGYWIYNSFTARSSPGLQEILPSLMCTIPLFFVASFFGLLMQSLFVYPLAFIVNRLILPLRSCR